MTDNNEFISTEREDHWISISDMMSGLMMIFLFIAISYMIDVIRDKERIKEIAITYNKLQVDLYDDLYKEFEKDLKDWNAVIDKRTISVRFESPEVLFEAGKDIIKPRFQEILIDFFPRYIEILSNAKYKNDIEEIRIEGHTSSDWINTTGDSAYFNNMRLSQDRTRSVLEFATSLPEISKYKEWLKENLTANGLSSSKLIITNGIEDKEASRRVEFRVKTNAERRIVKIIEEADNETN